MREPFDDKIERLTIPFLTGDKAAGDMVARMMLPSLINRAEDKHGLPNEPAYECAVDAIVYVKARGTQDWQEGASLKAALIRGLDWFAGKVKREWSKVDDNPELQSPDSMTGYSEPLVSLEEYRNRTGGQSHEYLTSITWASPEEEVVAENLRTWMENAAVAACGRDKWDIYYKVVVLDRTQREIAEELGCDQSTVSRTVDEVGRAIKSAMTGG